MRKTLRLTFILLSLSGLALSLVQLSKHWNYEDKAQDIAKLMQQSVSSEKLDKAISTAITEKHLDDAKMYLKIARLYHYPIDIDAYEQQITKINTLEYRVSNNVKNFTHGFIHGKGDDTASITGSVISDFTVIGDVRDLREQYIRQQEGKEVNKVVASLAGAGIGLTLVTIGTVGTTAGAKGGASLLKFAAKTKRLTKGFSKQLAAQGRKVFEWNKFSSAMKTGSNFADIRRAAKMSFHPKAIQPLKVTAKRMYAVRKASNTKDSLHMLRYVDNTKDLRRLETFTLKHGLLAKGYLKLLGKGILRTTKVLKKTTGFLLSVLGSIFSSLFSLLFMFSGRGKT